MECFWHYECVTSKTVAVLALQASTEEGQEACESMKIEVLPTIQFWKNKQLLWEHRGVTQLDQDLSEGLPLNLMTSCLYST